MHGADLVTIGKHIMYRLCLRLLQGSKAWHRRHYRPDVHVVKGSRHVWFEEAGKTVQTRTLSSLTGEFSGRCNLLLSGPSVSNIRDPLKLAESDWMGVNGSPALFGSQIPRMRVYHVNDSAFIRGSTKNFLRYARHADYTIVDYRAMYEILRLAIDHLPDTELVVYDSWNLPHHLPVGKIQQLAAPPEHRGVFWSNDPELGLAPGGTVAYTAAQIAWHGGYESLYLYGLDLTNSGRFYREDDPQPQMLDKAFSTVIVPAFELMTRETEGRFSVYNCNPESRLPGDILPKITAEESFFHQALRNKPI